MRNFNISLALVFFILVVAGAQLVSAQVATHLTSAVLTEPNVTGGTPPYYYQWYEIPPNSTAMLIPGATAKSYVFTVNQLTPQGIYQFFIQVTDSMSATTNSPPVNVSVFGIGVIKNSVALTTLPNINAPTYAPGAEALFAIGLLGSLLIIFLSFRVYSFYRQSHKYTIMDGIGGLSIGFICAILLIFSLFYTSGVSTPAYTINAPSNTVYRVASEQVSTLAIGTNSMFGLIGYAFILLDIILGFVYLFMAGIAWNLARKERQYQD